MRHFLTFEQITSAVVVLVSQDNMAIMPMRAFIFVLPFCAYLIADSRYRQA